MIYTHTYQPNQKFTMLTLAVMLLKAQATETYPCQFDMGKYHIDSHGKVKSWTFDSFQEEIIQTQKEWDSCWLEEENKLAIQNMSLPRHFKYNFVLRLWQRKMDSGYCYVPEYPPSIGGFLSGFVIFVLFNHYEIVKQSLFYSICALLLVEGFHQATYCPWPLGGSVFPYYYHAMIAFGFGYIWSSCFCRI